MIEVDECLLLNLILNVASAIPGITLSALLSIFIFVISKLVGWKSFVPLSNLISFQQGSHEWLCLVSYYLMGRTDKVF